MRNIKDKSKFTAIQVESRKLLRPKLMGIVVMADEEEYWVRTYSLDGWQRFPRTFIEENSIPVIPKEILPLEFELKAKGYNCVFCNIMQEEKETDDD